MLDAITWLWLRLTAAHSAMTSDTRESDMMDHGGYPQPPWPPR